MKYKMLAEDIVGDTVDIPENAIPATVVPNYQTNKWMIIYLVPAEEEPRSGDTEEGHGP